jgi:hypothetical protein
VIRRFRALEPFLYSRRNIVGSLLAVAGLALFFTGIIGGLTWLPIVAGLYAIGVLLVPGEPGLDLRLDAAGDLSAVQGGLDRLLSSVHGRVADDIYARISSIRGAILQILKAEDASIGAGDPNVYLIRQTALDYLPAALQAYLAVPRIYAERRAVAGGRTPHDVLLDQLTLMDNRMQQVLEDVLRHDSDKLLAQGRFIAEKFAPSALQLGVPGTAADAVPASSPDAEADADAEEVGVPASTGEAAQTTASGATRSVAGTTTKEASARADVGDGRR